MTSAVSSPPDLADALERTAGAIADRAHRDMYLDPFWIARFGERGRAYAVEDARYKVTYLVEALRAGSAKGFADFSIWLRGVLRARGMCSRHLADGIAAVSRSLGMLETETGDARAVLDSGIAALSYSAGEAAAVDAAVAHAPRIHPWDQRPGWTSTADAAHLLSYAADALDAGTPDPFLAHVEWAARHAAASGTTTAAVDAALAAAASIVAAGPPSARDLLLEARARLSPRQR